jgi:hypothetical protein
MAGKRARSTPGQTVAAWAVVVLLVVLAGWLWRRQSIISPAVEAALRPPPPAGSVRPAGAAAFATAAFLDSLPGAAAAGPVESFDPDTLSDKIDGKAELYLAAHFKEMSCRAFSAAGGAKVQAYLYAMAAPRDAFAVLSSQRRPGATASAITADASLTENTLSFTKGRHYVELVADRAGPGVQAGLTGLGTALAGSLPAETAGTAPRLSETTLFPSDGLEAASVRLAASDAMGLAGFSNVYTADYNLPQGQATAFLAVRSEAGQAVADAGAFAAFLTGNGYAPASPPPTSPPPTGATVLAMDGSFEIIFTRGPVLAGVHDAQSLEAALDLAGRLDKALEGKIP